MMNKYVLALLAVLNYLGVTALVFFEIKAVLFPLIFIATILCVYSLIDQTSSLVVVGGPFNFFGVVVGGLNDSKAVVYMAVFGMQLLVVGYVTPVVMELFYGKSDQG